MQLWLERLASLAYDFETSFTSFDITKYSAHPGTTVLLVAIGIYRIFHWSLFLCLVAAVSLINAFLLTLICAGSFWARPRNGWWAAAGLIILFNPLGFISSPTHAVFALLIVALFIVSWLLYERRIPLWLGGVLSSVLIGIGFSTLITPMLLFLPLPLFVLGKRFSWPNVAALVLLALAVAVATNPFLWASPAEYFRLAANKAFIKPLTRHNFGLSPAYWFYLTPLAIFSIIFGFVAAYLVPEKRLPLSRSEFITLFAASTLPVTVFIIARQQSLRYVLPVIYLWDIHLPLLLGALTLPEGNWKRLIAHVGMLLFVICAYTTVLYYYHSTQFPRPL